MSCSASEEATAVAEAETSSHSADAADLTDVNGHLQEHHICKCRDEK